MNDTLFLTSVLAVALVAVMILRSRPTAVKIVGEILLLGLIGGCLLARGTGPLPSDAFLTHEANAGWLRALAVVWWLIAARLVAVLTVLALGHDARSREARLVSDLLAGAIYVTAALIVVNAVLGFHVNGLLATSGIAAIVLGLALQNTLADVFSGIAVGIEGPFHVGERVGIGDHPEGIVVQMNWRAIRIQTDSDDLITVPNSIVARTTIINRSVPTQRRAASVDIPTLSPLRSETLIGLARQALLLCPTILAEPAPSVALKHLGTRATTLGIGYHVATTPDLSVARGQLLRQVRRLFRHAEGPDGQKQSPEALFAGIVLFEALKPEQIDGLIKALTSHRYDIGDEIFHEGSTGASLYIIRAGVFEVTREVPGGTPLRYGRIGPGEYLGEISMMSGDPRSVTVTALTDAEVYELPRTAVEALLAEDASLCGALERSIRRGLALLDRDDAARNAQPLDAEGSLLARIRSFLGHKG